MTLQQMKVLLLLGVAAALLTGMSVFLEEPRQYLGLHGCTVRDAAVSGDGSLVLAACRGPNGLYFSRDFGETWVPAEGGVYSHGQADGVAITDHGAYALVAAPSDQNSGTVGLLTSPLPAAGDPFSWSPVASFGNISASGDQLYGYIGLVSAERFIAVPMQRFNQISSTAVVRILDSSTNSIVATSVVPRPNTRIISMEIHAGHIFVVLTSQQNDSVGRALYRAPFDPDTGTIGEWEEITGNLIAAGSGQIPDSVHRGPNNSIFARIAVFGAQMQIWGSTDGGDTFTLAFPSEIGLNYFAPRSSAEAIKGCTQGASIIINNKLSTDGGATWANLFDAASTTFNLFDNDLCLFDPADTTNNRALVKLADGFRRVTGLDSESPSFSKANSGMNGILVYEMSQSKQQPGTIGLVTNAGLAFSRNFTSPDRKWLFPVCNRNKSCWANDFQRSAIGIDQNDPMIVYSGTQDVERGDISTDEDGNFSITWSTLMENPGDNGWDELRVVTTRHLPGLVMAMYRRVFDDPTTPELDERLGGLYFINNQNGAVVRSVLVDEPVYDFIALSDSLMFATVNGGADPAVDGIFRSSDGGATWVKESEGDASKSAGANRLVYDEARDILYATVFTWTSRASVMRLTQASTGATSWVNAPTMGLLASGAGIRDLVVDEVSGELFASTGRTIYHSTDQGVSWSEYFKGFVSEVFHAISIAPPEGPVVENVSARTRSQPQLIGASSVGVSKLSSAPVQEPPSDTPAIQCALSVAKSCRGRLRRGRGCQFRASATEVESKQKVSGVSVALERRIGTSAPWKLAKRAQIRRPDGVVISLAVRKSAQFRANVSDATGSCISSVVSVRIRQRGR